MPSATSVAFAKSHVKEILRREFNRTIELQVGPFHFHYLVFIFTLIHFLDAFVREMYVQLILDWSWIYCHLLSIAFILQNL